MLKTIHSPNVIVAWAHYWEATVSFPKWYKELIRVKSVNQIKFPDQIVQKESMVIELQPKVGEGVVPGLWLVATLNINSDVNGDFHQ